MAVNSANNTDLRSWGFTISRGLVQNPQADDCTVQL